MAGFNTLGGRKRTGLAELEVAFRGAWALDRYGKVLSGSYVFDL